VREYVQGRKAGKNHSQVKENNDLLTYLLADDLFGKPENEELVVDELLDFFVAASQTTTNKVNHIFHHLI